MKDVIPISRHRSYQKRFPVAPEVPETARLALELLCGAAAPTTEGPRLWTFRRGWKTVNGTRETIIHVGMWIGTGGPGFGPLWVCMCHAIGQPLSLGIARELARGYCERNGFPYEEST